MARRPPRRITAGYLEAVTGHYLERYATTSVHMRRLLMQRVWRSARFFDEDPEEWAELVDVEVARLVRIGALNDQEFATSRARVLHRRGNASRAIRAKLQAKGVTSEQIDAALEALANLSGDPDTAAACTWARKRRLGPWARQPSEDPELRQKHLAKFARAGFTYSIATRILDASTPEELEI